MKILGCIHRKLPNTTWIGTDIHEPSEAIVLPFDYVKFDGQFLAFRTVLSSDLHFIALLSRKEQ